MTVSVAQPRRRLRTKVRPDSYPAGPSSLVSKVASPPANSPATSSGVTCKGNFLLKEKHPEYVIVHSAFDAEMLERLGKFLARKRPQPAKMKNSGGDSDDERKARYDDRDSCVSWFNAKDECPWLHERLAEVTRDVGNHVWPLLRVKDNGDLECEYEETQFAVYGPNQHFKAWHQDAFTTGEDPEDARQVTIVAMLSSSSSYTGGQFQAKLQRPDGRRVATSLKLDAGDCLVFPAKKLVHRVCAVKSGIRKTLVFWAFDRMSCKYHASKAGVEPNPEPKQLHLSEGAINV